MAVFLTDEWFAQVEQLSNEAGELNLPPSLANMALNMKLTDVEQGNELSLQKGRLHKGLAADAPTTVVLEKQLLLSLLTKFDVNQAMEAFMNGKIRVEGDMSQLMALQSAKPSDEQKQLFKKIKSVTEFA